MERRRGTGAVAELLSALALVTLVGGLAAAEPLPYGHKDFVPTPERPVGFRGDGSGHFPGTTPPLTFSE
jgi:hypothetical protein